MKKKQNVKDINEYKKTKQNKHKKKVKKRFIRRGTTLFFTVCILSIIVFNICGNAVMSNLKYDIGSLEDELRKQEIILEQVKANVEFNTSIQEIESKAKEELNMDYPKESQIRYISVGN